MPHTSAKGTETARISDGEYLKFLQKRPPDPRDYARRVLFSGALEQIQKHPRYMMLSVPNLNIPSFVLDYQINLITPGEMSGKELDKFTTSLREVLLFIKHFKDKERFHTLIFKDSRFQSV